MKEKQKWAGALLIISLLVVAVSFVSVAKTKDFSLTKKQDSGIFVYKASEDGYESKYSTAITPTYYVFAGKQTKVQAQALIKQMGILSHLREWGADIEVLPPTNGTSYTKSDLDVFIKEMAENGVYNVKVIGIDDGATFVNDYVSQNCYAVAGIMTYGGTMKAGLHYNVPVPAYLSNASKTAVDYYVKANKANKVSKTTYQNTKNPLQKVVAKKDKTLAAAFSNAWKTVFRKNCRQNNETTECYMTDPQTMRQPYYLIGIADMDALHIQYNSHIRESVPGLTGSYTWFEYIPEATLSMPNGSIPLIVTLHGNGNDARIQGDTSGWVELAAKENVMVMAPEWQQEVLANDGGDEAGPNFFHCDGLEDEKLLTWLQVMELKYPQIDTSRIYVSGLSAGGSKAALYGVKYSDVFAGVGTVSSPGIAKEELAELAENYTGGKTPWIYLAGDHDFFGLIPVDGSSCNSFQVADGVYIQSVDENTKMFSFIQSYQKINGMRITEHYNMADNPYYGVMLENQTAVKLGEKEALEGVLSDESGYLIKLTAIKDQAHWNYKPEAAYIWDFLKGFSRNTQTGELQR